MCIPTFLPSITVICSDAVDCHFFFSSMLPAKIFTLSLHDALPISQRGPPGLPRFEGLGGVPAVNNERSVRAEHDIAEQLRFLLCKPAREVASRDLFVHCIGFDVFVKIVSHVRPVTETPKPVTKKDRKSTRLNSSHVAISYA